MARPQRIEPGPGQESVWDYPRPPRLERTEARVRVVHGGHVVAETTGAWRILETSQPPGYYLPPGDVDASVLMPAAGAQTFCEWKGLASYWDLAVPGAPVVREVAWSYPTPTDAYAAIADHLAFYPQRVDACFVDDEQVAANEGSFYGGWITSQVTGPFKGGAGSTWW
jgi:uncharacterized protein (DUF427 family)